MQQLWSAEELVEHWSLTPEELAHLPGRGDGGKLGFAVQLAFYKRHAGFPERSHAWTATCRAIQRYASIQGAVTRLSCLRWIRNPNRRTSKL
jgi:Domain of unknown function (DUF4158)